MSLRFSRFPTFFHWSLCWLAVGPAAIAAKPPVQQEQTPVPAPLSSPFATKVLDYLPGEGLYVNDPNFNDPARALGAPIGGGTLLADSTKLVTLGGFGGSITLGFDHTVADDPANHLGLDCIIFGNGVWIGQNPLSRWSEAAVIEISLDTNGNGLADDLWYLIPGSDISDPINQQRNGFYLLPDDPYAQPPLDNPNGDGFEAWWGYADLAPVLKRGDLDGDNSVDNPWVSNESFYTVPDDPLTVGVDAGSGGGDAFDIAWAVDPLTGQPADLPGFDFIRITSAVWSFDNWFGEVSAEIGGVADVGGRAFRGVLRP
ncbi:MAG: hypothetical protein D8M59_13565 [Planctomycetes bacterium]|nr:hypothetical protein [Planctomycetota bacterium]NOG53762.1 hypothetical protein [Planctomycetota bacterium]